MIFYHIFCAAGWLVAFAVCAWFFYRERVLSAELIDARTELHTLSCAQGELDQCLGKYVDRKRGRNGRQ